MTTRPPDPLEQHAAHFIARKNEEVASLRGGVHGAESVSRQITRSNSVVLGTLDRMRWVQRNDPIIIRINIQVKQRATKEAVIDAVVGGVACGALMVAAPVVAPTAPLVGVAMSWVARKTLWQKIATVGAVALGGFAFGYTRRYVYELTALRTSPDFIHSVQERATHAMRAHFEGLQNFVGRVDRRLVCPITDCFPVIPVTFNGQSYEMDRLLRWVTDNPDGNNSPRRDGHITLERARECDLTYFSRWNEEMNRLLRTRAEWLTPEVRDFILEEVAANHGEANGIINVLRNKIDEDFYDLHNMTEEDHAQLGQVLHNLRRVLAHLTATPLPAPAPAAASTSTTPTAAAGVPTPAPEGPASAAASVLITAAAGSVPISTLDDGATFDDELDATTAVADAIGNEFERETTQQHPTPSAPAPATTT